MRLRNVLDSVLMSLLACVLTIFPAVRSDMCCDIRSDVGPGILCSDTSQTIATKESVYLAMHPCILFGILSGKYSCTLSGI